ncbi:AI-2E family transporter [Eubacteriales bacterium OttesenSCG-928-K08]|nr:AI-2E family transporter [Eubacteriales bacterium OttesenSCG-928-K08]
MENPGPNKRGLLKRPILLITYAVLLFLLFYRLESVWGAVQWFLGGLSALFMGLVLAFLFHLPTDFFQYKVLKSFEYHKSRFLRSIWRALSLLLAYLSVLAFVIGLVVLVAPRFVESVTALAMNFGGYLNSFQSWSDGFLSSLAINPGISETITTLWDQAVAFLQSIMGTVVNKALNFTISFTSGLFNFVLAFMLSIFFLYNKETVFAQTRRFFVALLGQRRTNKFCEVLQLSNNVFSKFIFGQLTEALILGVLCFIGMSVFRMDYALLISTVIAITAIIPILGAYIGTIPCALILLVIDPVQAVWFVVFIIVLQQIEGNLIYPHVVGNAIGLSGLWVLVSIIIGGGLFGIWGMLLGTPIFAVCYHLVDRWLNRTPKVGGET